MNNFSLCHWRLISLGIFLFLTGCGLFSDKQNTTTHLKDGWSEVGLSGDSITRFKRNGQYLYAGTNNGLYRHDLSGSDKSWNNLGLGDHSIRDMVIFNASKILAAVAIADFASGDPTLFLTTDGGKSWKNYQNGFGGANHKTWIESLAQDPTNPDILYGARAFLIAKSTDQGASWSPVYGSWGGSLGMCPVLKVDPNRPGTIWAGGTNGLFDPILWKSTDYGYTWQVLLKNVYNDGVETNISDLLINPLHSDTLLIGEEVGIKEGNGIKRSYDDGQTWTKVYNQTPVYTLTSDPINTDQVYASGHNQTSTLFFASSPDFGDTWKIVTDSAGPSDIYTNTLLADTLHGKKVLYFGTNKGVYWYVTPE